MRKFYIVGLLLLTLFTDVVPVRGQGIIDGFMRGKGNTTVALSYSHERYDTYYVGNTETKNPNLGTITTQSVNLFAATGLTDYLDVVASVPYIWAKPSAGFWSPQSNFQDVALYVKAQPFTGKLGNLGKISTIIAAGIATPLSNYIADAPVAIGHQSTNLDGRLLVQYQSDFGLFAHVQGGYIRRSTVTLDRGYEVPVPDVADISARLGYAGKIVYADAWIHRQLAQSGTNIGPGVPFPTNAVTFTRVGGTLYFPVPKVKNLGVSVGTSFTLTGENIGRATRYSGGIVYNLPSWGGLSF